VIPEPAEDWRERARCRGTTPEWFFADTIPRGRPPSDPETRERFYGELRWRELCPVCPVRADCLAHALLHRERWGVWGGLTPAARRNIEAFIADGAVTWTQLTARWSNNRPGV
jgi:WhiB family redox-sensing transcriptional regulator